MNGDNNKIFSTNIYYLQARFDHRFNSQQKNKTKKKQEKRKLQHFVECRTELNVIVKKKNT